MGELELLYTIDDLDTVIELTEFPQCQAGAPCPAVVSGESYLHLAYYLNEQDPWDGTTVRFPEGQRSDELCALVRFKRKRIYMFGSPGEEIFSGHPLYKKGLKYYRVHEVKNSSWIRTLAKMDSVHGSHKPERFAKLRHFLFAFHDSTFECIAEDFELTIERGFVVDVLRASWLKQEMAAYQR